jgi:hypothetical protein
MVMNDLANLEQMNGSKPMIPAARVGHASPEMTDFDL